MFKVPALGVKGAAPSPPWPEHLDTVEISKALHFFNILENC